jgi:peptidyl-prolyl cis-trans isomerase A (cyclophilin A)
MLPVLLALAPAVAAAGQTTQPGMPPPPDPPETKTPDRLAYVLMTTSLGDIVLELNYGKAPITVKNFLAYTDDGFYDNTIFHRVIRGRIIQGGGLDPELVKKETRPPITNEWQNGLLNLRGTIAMARQPSPNSATSQFYINTGDNPSLSRPGRGAGYAVFGRVAAGMSVADAIQNVPTGRKQGYADTPLETVLIKEVRRLTPEDARKRIEAEKKPPTTKPAG